MPFSRNGSAGESAVCGAGARRIFVIVIGGQLDSAIGRL